DEAALGAVRTAGPDLLTVDPPDVAGARGARTKARQIRAGFRLGKALAPDVAHLQYRRKETPLLLLGADREDDGTGKFLADGVDAFRHRERADFLIGNQVLAQASAVAAIGLRPCDARQPRAIHRGLPGDRLLQRRRRERGAVTAKVRRQVGAKPATHRLPI